MTARSSRDRTSDVPPAERVVAQFAVDMRLTHDALKMLDAEQVQAVFEGVGKLAAAGLVKR